ncbi:MAG: 5'/3'-nucleotidase SurE [Methylococcales bacterium]|nr:5'/3'-nucleotidase SurE [Methylococcales bacterium]MBT7445439.1 5'/3'-nucleotidase SurE [Methylococcales bacterium]
MKILISNDDGYLAPGILALAGVLESIGDVTVVAPDRNRSGASNSLTLELPLRARITENGFYSVDGTPTDCVHLALTGLLSDAPDIVVSGINAGANMGDDVLYSGTVAAATEGRFLGFSAIAFSVASHQPRYFQDAARVALEVVEKVLKAPLTPDTVLNVNMPDLPYDQIQGYEVTRLGRRHKSEPVIKGEDPRGNPLYWVGPCGAEQDAGPGTDFHAINNNKISLTPLKIDLTDYRAMDVLSEWMFQEG